MDTEPRLAAIELIQRYHPGRDPVEVLTEAGISAETVDRHFRPNGIDTRLPSVDEIAVLNDAIGHGCTVSEVLQALQRDKRTMESTTADENLRLLRAYWALPADTRQRIVARMERMRQGPGLTERPGEPLTAL